MKRSLIVVMVALLAGCAEYQVVDGDSVEIRMLVDMAAVYFFKAEDHALLFMRDGQWQLDYHKTGGETLLSDEDVKRLERFVFETD